MHKVLLVGINSQYIHSNLAIRYLKAYTQDLPYEVILKEYTVNDRIENILEDILCEKPDIIGFSCYIWNVEYVNRLTVLINSVNKDIEIILGGPEVSYDAHKTFGTLPIDYIIEGEGEETYRELLEAKLLNNNIEEILGLYYRKGEEVLYKGPRKLMDMNKLIFPYNSKEDLENKIVYYEGSRGCPFNCKYCLSSTVHGVRFLDIIRVKNELDYLIDHKVKLVKFVDRTFNCNHAFAKEIWGHLIERKTDTVFHFEISADLLTKEEIELLRRAPKGRFQFEVGVQTTDSKVLSNINRKVNFEILEEKVNELLSLKNIHQHLDLIAGLPEDTLDSFIKSFNDVHSIEPEVIQLGFLKLLKGSSMREDSSKYNMVYSPYPPYEILKTSTMSYEDLMELKRVEAMLDKYYNSGKFNTALKYLILRFSKPYDFYKSLGDFFKRKGYFKRSLSGKEYYKVLIDFFEESFKEENIDNLSELVKFDFLSFNKKRGVPDYFQKKISKAEEIALRERYKLKHNEVYIDLFSIDINNFLKRGVLINIPQYIIFDLKNENNIIDMVYKDYK